MIDLCRAVTSVLPFRHFFYMKNTFLALLLSGLPVVSYAQVDNYCLHLEPQGEVDCGLMTELDHMAEYTLQFWVNADEWTEGAGVLTRGEELQVALGGPNTLNFVLGKEKLSVTNSALTTGQWRQITLIVQQGTATILCDQKQILQNSGDFELPQSSQNFKIGRNFSGRLDELRIWQAALKPDFDYFVHNTLNKWTPQLNDLVAYYKFDQEQCSNVVDYKALFVPTTSYNHHGVFSSTGVKRELVTDNAGLPYLLCGAYTNNSRFFDRAIAAENYLLANDLIILGIKSFPDGHLKYASTCDHGTLGKGVEHLAEFEGRSGVIAFHGEGGLSTTTDVLTPIIDSNGKASQGYSFETWLYLDQWTPGAYIFKKMTDDGKGFAISLGNEENHEVIVNVNGNKYVNIKSLETGKWVHFGVSVNAGGSTRLTYLFAFDGKAKWANTGLSSGSTDFTPSGNEDCVAVIGEGLQGKMDETVIWHANYQIDGFKNHMNQIPFPGVGKKVTAETIDKASAYFKYDDEACPGWDSFSQDEWKNLMLAPYKGYRGYQVRISVMGHKNWQQTISSAAKRKIFAQDLAQLSQGYDGVELDLEWMDGTQTTLGLLAQEIRKALPQDKSLMISCHAYGAYRFPIKDMKAVDGFTFQLYGPGNTWCDLASFKRSTSNFLNYGFPKDQIYMSYSTTTSAPYDENGKKAGNAVTGWRKILEYCGYEPSDDMSLRKAKVDNMYYYYMSPEQVYQKSKYTVEQHLKGIFFWDMGNDVNADQDYCLAKYANYALCSNVDTLVTDVQVNHPTGIASLQQERAAMHLTYDKVLQRLSVKGHASVLTLRVYTLSGRMVAEAVGDSVDLSHVPDGIYVVEPVSPTGKLPALTFKKQH